MDYSPPFTISSAAISMIAEISALVERYVIRLEQADGLRLRRVNRIRTIRSSLAIEGNALTEKQVTDILDGKRIVAPLREIQEANNAIAAYDMAAALNPFSLKDLLKAHGVMTTALINEPGRFRTGNIGVVSGMQVIHQAPPPALVPKLMQDLFGWLKRSQDHLLLRSCVFHYEFEFIHPFTDGNGRMGRLWQSLLLSRLHPVFRHLPVETMVHDNQDQYYAAIKDSTTKADCEPFVDFMLGVILHSLKAQKTAGINHHDAMNGAANGAANGAVNGAAKSVLEYIIQHPGVRANLIAVNLRLPIRSVQRYLQQLRNQGRIEFRGAPKNGGYHAKSL